MDNTVIIEAGFRGPPETGNGGYVGGLLAERIASPAEATLRRPVPLARPLTLERDADDALQLRDGTALLVECRTATLDLDAAGLLVQSHRVPVVTGDENAVAGYSGRRRKCPGGVIDPFDSLRNRRLGRSEGRVLWCAPCLGPGLWTQASA